MVFIQIESSISGQIMRDFSIEFFTKNYHWNKKCCFKFQCRRNICRHKRTFILRSWDNCRSVVKAARDVGKYMTKTKCTRWGARTLDHRIKSPALYQTELTGWCFQWRNRYIGTIIYHRQHNEYRWHGLEWIEEDRKKIYTKNFSENLLQCTLLNHTASLKAERQSVLI